MDYRAELPLAIGEPLGTIKYVRELRVDFVVYWCIMFSLIFILIAFVLLVIILIKHKPRFCIKEIKIQTTKEGDFCKIRVKNESPDEFSLVGVGLFYKPRKKSFFNSPSFECYKFQKIDPIEHLPIFMTWKSQVEIKIVIPENLGKNATGIFIDIAPDTIKSFRYMQLCDKYHTRFGLVTAFCSKDEKIQTCRVCQDFKKN